MNPSYFYNQYKFYKDKRAWLNQGGEITIDYPIIDEHALQAGDIDFHYFNQDLLVANDIYKRNPKRHIDIGSRIDGFVSHLAVFREVEVFDVRPMHMTLHKNIIFTQINISKIRGIQKADSISCLHAIEHFGLGRYGDSIDVDGHLKGLKNIISMMNNKGILYLSFPIGKADEVYFNAHRVFNPKSILQYDFVMDNLKLVNFDYVDDDGKLYRSFDIFEKTPNVNKYGCGIYTFQRKT